MTKIHFADVPVVLWVESIALRPKTGYSPVRLRVDQDAVLPIELENIVWNTADWTIQINITASLLVGRSRQLE